MTWWQAAVVLAAALGAGLINSVAGGGTLLSFPALVWIGVPPVIANATNTVAIWPGQLAGMIGFWRHLRGTSKWIAILIPPSIAGALAGAIILLRTPPSAFGTLAPYLVLGATLLLAARGPLSRFISRRGVGKSADSGRHWAIGFQLLVALYGGYFGAGIGILMLAALALMGLSDIYQMSGLKNLLALSINGIAAAYFVASGAVIWRDALLMTAGSIAGGFLGASLARRVGAKIFQRAIVVIGLVMALSLFLIRR